jgi:hypothetical protein
VFGAIAVTNALIGLLRRAPPAAPSPRLRHALDANLAPLAVADRLTPKQLAALTDALRSVLAGE